MTLDELIERLIVIRRNDDRGIMPVTLTVTEVRKLAGTKRHFSPADLVIIMQNGNIAIVGTKRKGTKP